MAAQHSPSLFSFLSKRLRIALLDVHARQHWQAIANRLRELEGEVEVLHALTVEQRRDLTRIQSTSFDFDKLHAPNLARIAAFKKERGVLQVTVNALR
jgi:hypothetical protein